MHVLGIRREKKKVKKVLKKLLTAFFLRTDYANFVTLLRAYSLFQLQSYRFSRVATNFAVRQTMEYSVAKIFTHKFSI